MIKDCDWCGREMHGVAGDLDKTYVFCSSECIKEGREKLELVRLMGKIEEELKPREQEFRLEQEEAKENEYAKCLKEDCKFNKYRFCHAMFIAFKKDGKCLMYVKSKNME